MTEAISGQDGSQRLREQLALIRARKWSIAAIVGIALVASIATSLAETPTYASTARVLVKPITSNQQGAPSVPPDQLLDMATEAQVVRSIPVAQLAARKMAVHVPHSKKVLRPNPTAL